MKETLPALTEADRQLTRCHRVGFPETEGETELDIEDVYQGSTSEEEGVDLGGGRSWAVMQA